MRLRSFLIDTDKLLLLASGRTEYYGKGNEGKTWATGRIARFLCLVSDAFGIFARRSSLVLGSAWAFAGAILIIVIWGLTGPTFHYSDTWQLIINTGTTIVTFLMVFLIQNTQNRDAKAVHLKLDELIRALKGARNELIDLETLTDEDLTSLEKQFSRVRKKAERNGNNPRGRPEQTVLSARPRIFRRRATKLCRPYARDLCLTTSAYQN